MNLTILQQILALKLQLLQLVKMKEKVQGLNNRERLYYAAKSCLGTDASPNDLAPDEYGCVDSLSQVYRRAFGYGIGEDLSTYRLYSVLINSPLFIRAEYPLRGDIILSPSGYGNGNLKSGHVGIVGDNNIIYSNDSATGLFSTKYSLNDWKIRYQQQGGFPIHYFRRM